MPKLSEKKKDKISEHILSVLYDNFPKPLFTSEIAAEVARDEEFTKKLLLNLKDKQLAVLIDKTPLGLTYIKRARWRLSNKVQEAYFKQTNNKINNSTNNSINSNLDLNSKEI